MCRLDVVALKKCQPVLRRYYKDVFVVKYRDAFKCNWSVWNIQYMHIKWMSAVQQLLDFHRFHIRCYFFVFHLLFCSLFQCSTNVYLLICYWIIYYFTVKNWRIGAIWNCYAISNNTDRLVYVSFENTNIFLGTLEQQTDCR